MKSLLENNFLSFHAKDYSPKYMPFTSFQFLQILFVIFDPVGKPGRSNIKTVKKPGYYKHSFLS